ncbi:hypothetical protein O6H91_01G142100 [Diphasiastrum complanatum]|nr:hypothetical protein O6H91_01G060700 [Diphasiastrum complanatum]KAJ7570959.1 hypothetical protein O6H91_01G142100 [Diphasiastrum complanatum]
MARWASRSLLDRVLKLGGFSSKRSICKDLLRQLEQQHSMINFFPYIRVHELSSESLATHLPRTGSSGTIGKRFYEIAHMKPMGKDGEFVVMLDNRVLKTPAKKVVKVPSPSLAMAIAAEWEAQASSGIRPYTMPLMKLTATAIDQIPQDRDRVISSLLNYFHTDAVCCRSSEPAGLAAKQAQLWDPLLDWAEKVLGVRPTVSSSLFVTNQPDNVVQVLETALRNTNDWELAAVDFLAGAARSLIIAMAVFDEHLNIDEALKAIRVEEDYQIEAWGLVEGGHDVDMADLRVKVSAASVFLKLLSANSGS